MTAHADSPAGMPLAREIRAYFAPVDRVNGVAAVFDPALHGNFDLNAPPAPWVSLGTIRNLKRTPAGEVMNAAAGRRGLTRASWRTAADARVEFDFVSWGKLQMAIAAGAEHLNLLEADANASARPSGAEALAGSAVLPGSTASEMLVGAGVAAYFLPGDLVAVDVDYAQQTGYVGSGVAAAYVADPAAVQAGTDFIRRVTMNVGRVAGVTANSLLLEEPLVGGAPLAGCGVQRVTGFVDREGPAFFQEWAALMVVSGDWGGRVMFFYPHLRSARGAEEVEERVADTFLAPRLHGSFVALPQPDLADGEPVVCYRSYIPGRVQAE